MNPRKLGAMPRFPSCQAARRRLWLAGFAGVVAGLAAAGCAPRPPEGARAAATVRPAPKPEKNQKDPPLAGAVGGASATLFDAETGRVVAQVKSTRGALGQTVGTGRSVARLASGEATLYDKRGQPLLFLRADSIEADRETQQIVGVGNVGAVSLAEPGAPLLRADRMTWNPKDRVIRGQDNVLITRTPDLHLPGRAFEADRTVRRFTVWGDGRTATLTFDGNSSARTMKNKTFLSASAAAAVLATAMTSRMIPPAQAAAPGAAKSASRQGGASATSRRIGDVRLTIPNFNTVRIEQPDTNSQRFVIDGEQPAVVTSARYDLAAPQVQLVFRRAKSGAPFKAASANLSGGVRVEARQTPEPGDVGEPRRDTVTCDTATYVALDTPEAVGRIDFKGNVRTVSRGGIFGEEPAVSTSKSAFIILRRDGTQSIEMNKGSATATVRERTPRPKTGGGNR